MRPLRKGVYLALTLPLLSLALRGSPQCPGDCTWADNDPTMSHAGSCCDLAVMMIVEGSSGSCTPACEQESGCEVNLSVKYESSCSDNVIVINCGGSESVTLTGPGPCASFCGAGWRRNDTIDCGSSLSCTATLTNSSAPGEVATGSAGGECDICDE